MIRFTLSMWQRNVLTVLPAIFCLQILSAQETFPVNGIAEPKEGSYAFIHATIVRDAQTTMADATLLIHKGKIVAAGPKVGIPRNAVIIDCTGKYIYPSFIDIFSDYGQTPAARNQAPNSQSPVQAASRGASGWNPAIRAEVEAYRLFTTDKSKARLYRDAGFGTVLTHQKDGISRGTGAVVTLSEQNENAAIVKERASAHYSFNKGSSTLSYPASLMGAIALLRQTYLDAQWYKNKPVQEGVNQSLQGWIDNQSLPQIFDANDKWNAVRADRIGDEFGIQYIIKGGGNEYQRIREMAATKAIFILPLNYPGAMDVEDPGDARFVSLSDMKSWEMAPSNPAAFERSNIPFCLTASDLTSVKQFPVNLRKAIEFGLSETKALEALTRTPATVLGIFDKVGSLDPGKLASFLITSGPMFNAKTTIFQNWVQGEKYAVDESAWIETTGTYQLTVTDAGAPKRYILEVKSANAADVIGNDTVSSRYSNDGKSVKISFSENSKSPHTIRLSGIVNDNKWNGTGIDSAGHRFTWTADLLKPSKPAADTAKKKAPPEIGVVTYPFNGYGWEEMPKQENLLIRDATVWTNDKQGKIEHADVLIKNGKIVQVGKNLSDASSKVITGTGKHVTPGIIDEHSHIAAASINEGGQSVTSEVRIKDNLNPEDINIYRQLSGGVTSSHILHGSANTIGGQTQLIKLRWGGNDNDLMFAGSDGFIKFALGENVKRSSYSQGNTRFPDTRMGVEQVLEDAFQRAKDYQRARKESEAAGKKKGLTAKPVRRDLELEALVEILDRKRFITCHSYIQSEITAALRVADRLGFAFNTFTHILEGYKVADKMKAHGSGASTFSDWWNYKMEVTDAIPYNATIMQRAGMNVAINSDDPEMARRLNQEAAKSVKYGGMSEEDALKMVTLNPAIMLHVQDRVGSITPGKDADLVIWTDHPLSMYAKAEKTIVDGIIYFDRERDMYLRKRIAEEKSRLVKKMLLEKKGGVSLPAALPSMEVIHSCGDHHRHHGVLTIDADEQLQR